MKFLTVIASLLILSSGIDAAGRRPTQGSPSATKPPTAAALDLKIPLDCARQYPKYAQPISECVRGMNLASCVGALEGAEKFLGDCCDSFKASPSPLAAKIVGVCDSVRGMNISLPSVPTEYAPCLDQMRQIAQPCLQSVNIAECAKNAQGALKSCCPILQQKASESFSAKIAYTLCSKLEDYLPGGSSSSGSSNDSSDESSVTN
jgi:hypothetical protein